MDGVLAGLCRVVLTSMASFGWLRTQMRCVSSILVQGGNDEQGISHLQKSRFFVKIRGSQVQGFICIYTYREEALELMLVSLLTG